MDKFDIEDDVIIVNEPVNFVIVVDGKILEISPDNIVPVVRKEGDWVVDQQDYDDKDAYDRAMTIL